MTLGGTPLSIISKQRIKQWASSILEEIRRTLITCVSSHYSPAKMRTKKKKAKKTEAGLLEPLCSIEAKLLFDLQPDKINYALGHSRYGHLLFGHLLRNSLRMYCAC